MAQTAGLSYDCRKSLQFIRTCSDNKYGVLRFFHTCSIRCVASRARRRVSSVKRPLAHKDQFSQFFIGHYIVDEKSRRRKLQLLIECPYWMAQQINMPSRSDGRDRVVGYLTIREPREGRAARMHTDHAHTCCTGCANKKTIPQIKFIISVTVADFFTKFAGLQHFFLGDCFLLAHPVGPSSGSRTVRQPTTLSRAPLRDGILICCAVHR